MATTIPGFETLSSQVNGFLLTQGYSTDTAAYMRHENLAISGVKAIMEATGTETSDTASKTGTLKLDAAWSAPFPCDYRKWIAIGYYSQDGRILRMNSDPQIALWQRKNGCGTPQPAGQKADGFQHWNHYGTTYGWAGSGNQTGSYGHLGGNTMPGFREDVREGRFLFDTNVSKGQDILIEYIPTNQIISGETLVPEDQSFKNALYLYIRKEKASASSSDYRKEVDLERRFTIAVQNLRTKNFKMRARPQDVVNAWKKYSRLTPQ